MLLAPPRRADPGEQPTAPRSWPESDAERDPGRNPSAVYVFEPLSSIIIASVSSMNSGFPSAAEAIPNRQPSGRSVRAKHVRDQFGAPFVAVVAPGKIVAALSFPPPQPDRRSSSSGRAVQKSRIEPPGDQSAMCSTRSRNVSSLEWRSSNMTTSARSRATASRKCRMAQKGFVGGRRLGHAKELGYPAADRLFVLLAFQPRIPALPPVPGDRSRPIRRPASRPRSRGRK